MPESLQPEGVEGVGPSVNPSKDGEPADLHGASLGPMSSTNKVRARVLDDPRPSLAPAAARIVDAAQRVLLRKGFGGLTLKAIAEDSGENSAMVQYYFGNKAGLVKAMIDANFREEQQHVALAMSAVTGDDLLPKFVEGLRTISLSRSYRVFFDILPYVLRHEQFKNRMAEVLEWYRQIKLDWLRAEGRNSPAQTDAMLGFAELMVAVVDGLAIQKAVDDEFDLARPYAVLESMLDKCLPELLGTDSGSEQRAGITK